MALAEKKREDWFGRIIITSQEQNSDIFQLVNNRFELKHSHMPNDISPFRILELK